MKYKEIVFGCHKCGHLLFVADTSIKHLIEIMQTDCPNCGEEGYENWLMLRAGNYDKEYGSEK
jgi:transcription elongation factor Elf1